jgi:hypothetical protein
MTAPKAAKMRVILAPRGCRLCGAVFQPTRPWMAFCSHSCRYTHYNRHSRVFRGTGTAVILLLPTGILWASQALGVIL